MTSESIEINSEILETMKSLDLPMDDYMKIKEIMEVEMAAGLTKVGNDGSSLKMLPTYVRNVTNGTEHGHYLALDFGGTNLRVYMIRMHGTSFHEKSKAFPIPEKYKTGSGEQLFDYFASCIAEFLSIHDIEDQKMALGFTFSFWAVQKSLLRAHLVKWSKGFVCPGVEGEDLATLLNTALKKKNMPIECVAVTNDTVGCMLSTALTERNVQIGVIFGTGTNACFMENLDNVELWDQDLDDPKQVIINCEWGALGDNGCIDSFRTDIDIILDKETTNPKEHLFEKMIAGKYLGEIARLYLIKLIKAGLLLKGEISKELAKPYALTSKYLICLDIEMNNYTVLTLDYFGYKDPSPEDCVKVQFIFGLVVERAARLAATGLAVLLNRINKPEVTIAVDGSLYKYNECFQRILKEHINLLKFPSIEYKIVLSEDGSGRGAALVAAVACEEKK